MGESSERNDCNQESYKKEKETKGPKVRGDEKKSQGTTEKYQKEGINGASRCMSNQDRLKTYRT